MKTVRSDWARESDRERKRARQAEATPVSSQVEDLQACRPRSGGTTREEGLDGRLTSSETAKQGKKKKNTELSLETNTKNPKESDR